MVGLVDQAHELTMYPELSCWIGELIWLVIRHNFRNGNKFQNSLIYDIYLFTIFIFNTFADRYVTTHAHEECTDYQAEFYHSILRIF